MAAEEYHFEQSPARPEEAMPSFRDYLSDITGDEERPERPDGRAKVSTPTRDESVASVESKRVSRKESHVTQTKHIEFEQRKETRTNGRNHDNRHASPARLSPFSPELRQRSRRPRMGEDYLEQATSGSLVTWVETGDDEHLLMSTDYSLSLSQDRLVTVVVNVQQPPPKTHEEEREGRLPCVFPMAAFSSKSKQAANAGFPLSSPTSVAMSAVDSTRKITIVNPSAFGRQVPNEVSMEVLKRIVGHSMSSEDWVREFRFNQVLWPSGEVLGLSRIAQAICEDMTSPASIAHRTVVGYGQEDKRFAMFGSTIAEGVAQGFASAAQDDSMSETQQYGKIAQRFGLLGLTLNNLLEIKRKQEETNGVSSITVGLALMEITGEEKFVDLSETSPHQKPSNSSEPVPPLKLVYTGDGAGGVLAGQKIHEITSLRELGHFMRRAYRITDHRRRQTKRGHVLATLYFYHNEKEFGKNTKLPMAHFVDLATPTSIDLTDVDADQNKDLIAARTRRNASVRKTITALGAVLRGSLLRDGGNSVSVSYRESLLTKVLQKSIEHKDARVVLLTSISPMKEEYDRTMEYLRFSNRLLERPGEPLKSPFDSLSKSAAGTNATSPTSVASEQSEQISLSEIDEKHHKYLLQTLTSDARQRLSKAGLHAPPVQNYVYLSPQEADGQHQTAEEDTGYEQLDPSDFNDQPNRSALAARLGQSKEAMGNTEPGTSDRKNRMSRLPTPLTRNFSHSKKRVGGAAQSRPMPLDTSFASDGIPSPITADAGGPDVPDYAGVEGMLDSKRKEEPVGASKAKDDPPESVRVVDDAPENNPIVVEDLSSAISPRRLPTSTPVRDERETLEPRAVHNISIPSLSHMDDNLGGRDTPINVERDNDNDTDTISQMEGIDATYLQLRQNSHENAENVSTYLRALQESEQSIIRRISAERDMLRKKHDRLATERQEESRSHDRELRQLREHLERMRVERNELEQIAEEAVAGREELVNSVHRLQRQLDKIEEERVPLQEYEQLQRENRQLSNSLHESKAEIHRIRTDFDDQQLEVSELSAALRTIEGERSDLAKRNTRDSGRIIELEEELREMKSQVSSLHADLGRSTDARNSLEAAFEKRETDLRSALDQSEAEKEELRKEITVMKDSMGEWTVERDTLLRERTEVQESLESLTRERDELSDKATSLERENQLLKGELKARAADVTDLAAAAQELQNAKDDLDARLQVESAAKAKAQSTANGLVEALHTMKEETKKRLDPLVQYRRNEQAINRDLIEENEELRLRNERLQERVDSMIRQERRTNEMLQHRESLRERETERLRAPEETVHDPSKERLEDLALNLSLIVRNIPTDQESRDSRDLAGLELHIRNTEHITDLLLKTLRQRVREIRRRRMGDDFLDEQDIAVASLDTSRSRLWG